MDAISCTISFENGRQFRIIGTRLLTEGSHLTLSSLRVPEVHAWLLSKMS
jgi:hypothetical protein